MILAVASGKGGTGKTTVAVNLAKALNTPALLLDCDVEAPNDHLFLKTREWREEVVGVPIPQVVESQCDGCGECSKFCQFNAIITLKSGVMVFPDLCHNCGGCVELCPRQALKEVSRRIGVIRTYREDDLTLCQGCLDVGVSSASPLIRAVKALRRSDMVTILDAPPGTSCPVVTTLQDADYVALVTEPTPFGLNDLKLAVALVRELRIPFGVVINRVGVGDDRVHRYCLQENIPILMEIPDDRRIAEAYSYGKLLIEALPEYQRLFQKLFDNIKHHLALTSGLERAS